MGPLADLDNQDHAPGGTTLEEAQIGEKAPVPEPAEFTPDRSLVPSIPRFDPRDRIAPRRRSPLVARTSIDAMVSQAFSAGVCPAAKPRNPTPTTKTAQAARHFCQRSLMAAKPLAASCAKSSTPPLAFRRPSRLRQGVWSTCPERSCLIRSVLPRGIRPPTQTLPRLKRRFGTIGIADQLPGSIRTV